MTRQIKLKPDKTGLKPVLPEGLRILILGSLPGDKSLYEQQYYAHPRNLFWPVMARLLNFPVDSDYRSRLDFLTQAGIGLWDVIEKANRHGSLDSAIAGNSIKINSLTELITVSSQLELVVLNGRKAENLFMTKIWPWLTATKQQSLKVSGLPSTSPANASIPRETKIQVWLDCLQPVVSVATGR